MKQDKELLLKDLCARLPYNVRVEYNGTTFTNIFDVLGIAHGRIMLCLPFMSKTECPLIEEVKPYLFPISSIAEEQWKEITDIQIQESLKSLDSIDDSMSNPLFSTDDLKTIEWCYANHIDIHDLIPMGLANDATGLNVY